MIKVISFIIYLSTIETRKQIEYVVEIYLHYINKYHISVLLTNALQFYFWLQSFNAGNVVNKKNPL